MIVNFEGSKAFVDTNGEMKQHIFACGDRIIGCLMRTTEANFARCTEKKNLKRTLIIPTRLVSVV